MTGILVLPTVFWPATGHVGKKTSSPQQTYKAGGQNQQHHHFIIPVSWHSDARMGQGDVENKTACAAIRWPITISKRQWFWPFRASQESLYLSSYRYSKPWKGRKISFACLFISRCLFTCELYLWLEWGSERFDVKPTLPLLTQVFLRRLQPIEFICVPFGLAGLWSLITSWDKAGKQGSCYFWNFWAMQIAEVDKRKKMD